MKPLSKQSNTVVSHLRAFPHLTAMQADGVYHIRRLASRIDEIRAAGYEVEKQTKEDAKGQRYTRYSFSKRQRRAINPLLPVRVATLQLRIETVESLYRIYCHNELGIDRLDLDSEVSDFVAFLRNHA